MGTQVGTRRHPDRRDCGVTRPPHGVRHAFALVGPVGVVPNVWIMFGWPSEAHFFQVARGDGVGALGVKR